jgi:cystine transport system ATP-binding protein
MLTADHIEKRIGANQLLADVSVTIAPGRATVIVGPNGSGKSTLLRALALIDPPTSGKIIVDENVYDFSNGARVSAAPWPRVTIVFQQLFLWPHLTLRENILLPMRNRRLELVGFDALVAELGMESLLHRHPNEVSLGERQCAAIIRAVVLRPSYLLLDEATSALDIEHSQRVFGLLCRLKDQGTGIGIVTHFFGFAQRLADEVVFLEGGRLLETGAPAILMRPTTERMQRFVSLVESGTTN